MTRYLLDTNLVSELIKPKPSSSFSDWLREQNRRDLFIAAMTVAEMQRGIQEMPRGKRRDGVDAWFAGADGPTTLFAGRILAFDERAAFVWARLMAEGRSLGRPRDAVDMIIAATAEVGGCIVATANERDFAGIAHINPMREPL